MWQEVRTELHPRGVEIVTVALDTGGVEAAAAFIDAAKPEHPSLIDAEHRCDELFGIVNVPTGVWIDEGGAIVRPPEPAWPGKSMFREIMTGQKIDLEKLDPYLRDMLVETSKIRVHPARYLEGLRDWADKGAASSFVLPPDEVLARSRARPPEASRAAAHFSLAQHLWRAGHRDDATAHFKEARRLQPENWTYKRQAWSFVDPLQRPSETFEGDWLSDVRAIGAENYYEPLEM